MESSTGTALLTLKEAAAALRIQPSTLRSWVLKRRIKFQKIGGAIRFRHSDLLRFIEDATVEAQLTTNKGGCRK
jgi:excisionase family DNA binding protein